MRARLRHYFSHFWQEIHADFFGSSRLRMIDDRCRHGGTVRDLVESLSRCPCPWRFLGAFACIQCFRAAVVLTAVAIGVILTTSQPTRNSQYGGGNSSNPYQTAILKGRIGAVSSTTSNDSYNSQYCQMAMSI